MVSLENKIRYVDSIKSKPKLLAFFKFIYEQKLEDKKSENLIEIDMLYYDFILSFRSNDEKSFSKSYSRISKRKPSHDSNWIHNDLLLFIIICGVVKFNLSKDWIKNVIKARPISNKFYNSVSQTFNNILKENYTSTDNLFEIIIVFLYMVNQQPLSKDLLDNAYMKFINNSEYFEQKNDFLIMMLLRAYDLIILIKEMPNANKIPNLREFKKIFVRRVQILRDIIYFSLCIILILVNFYLINTSESFKSYVINLDILFGILGLGLFVFFKWVRVTIGWVILKLFGYLKVYKLSELNKRL